MVPEPAWPLFKVYASPLLSLESNMDGLGGGGWCSEPVILENTRAEGQQGDTCCE